MKADLSSPRNRLLLAAAISLALHEAAAGLVPRDLWRPAPSNEIVTRAQILRVARLIATPTPRPVRTAEPVRPAAAPAPRRAAAAPPQVAQASAHRPEPRRSVVPTPSQGRPVWDATESGNGHAVVASAGTGTNGSAGAADGGGAAPNDTRPCGFVTFSDPHGSQYDSRTHGFWVDIRMSVRFADGTTQSMILDYPWYYPSEAANPWSDANLRDPNFPTRFQQPPPGKATGEPPLVQYVMAHSTAEGLTLLRDCPGSSS
ncbi:MAG: hypothetical protein JO003_07580 [Candidatus Eremiobacteraeota bacterium]|nr:hypothetical protein [Candidatus Eremiobacteraeota bacterium]